LPLRITLKRALNNFALIINCTINKCCHNI
jgi:hypothetical protein